MLVFEKADQMRGNPLYLKYVMGFFDKMSFKNHVLCSVKLLSSGNLITPSFLQSDGLSCRFVKQKKP